GNFQSARGRGGDAVTTEQLLSHAGDHLRGRTGSAGCVASSCMAHGESSVGSSVGRHYLSGLRVPSAKANFRKSQILPTPGVALHHRGNARSVLRIRKQNSTVKRCKDERWLLPKSAQVRPNWMTPRRRVFAGGGPFK